MLPQRIGSIRVHAPFSCLFGVLLVLGCGGKEPASAPASAPAPVAAPDSAPQATPTQRSPQDVAKLYAREAEPIAPQEVTFIGNVAVARIESKSPPQIGRDAKVANVVTVDADLGWEGPVHCYLFPEEFDAGGTVTRMLSGLEKISKVRTVAPYAIENAGVNPIVFVRALYEMPGEGGRTSMGDLKIMVAPRDPGAVTCVLDVPGYQASFQRIAGDFARSFEFAEKPEPVKREELWITGLDAATADGRKLLPTGFTRWQLFEGSDKGAFVAVSSTSKFIPTSEGELSTSDSISVTTLDKQGAILEGTWVEADGGVQALLTKLEKTEKGYEYSGELQSKPIEGAFTSKLPLTDDYALNKRFAALARAGKPARFETASYIPWLDPTGPSLPSYELEPTEGGFSIEGKLSGMLVHFMADTQGAPRSYRVPTGSEREVYSKLVFEQGTL